MWDGSGASWIQRHTKNVNSHWNGFFLFQKQQFMVQGVAWFSISFEINNPTKFLSFVWKLHCAKFNLLAIQKKNQMLFKQCQDQTHTETDVARRQDRKIFSQLQWVMKTNCMAVKKKKVVTHYWRLLRENGKYLTIFFISFIYRKFSKDLVLFQTNLAISSAFLIMASFSTEVWEMWWLCMSESE